MFEEGDEVGKILERAHEFLQVLEPARGFGRAVLLPEIRVARFLENGLGEIALGHRAELALASGRSHPAAPARSAAAWVSDLLGLHDHPGAGHERQATGAPEHLQDLQGRISQSALWAY